MSNLLKVLCLYAAEERASMDCGGYHSPPNLIVDIENRDLVADIDVLMSALHGLPRGLDAHPLLSRRQGNRRGASWLGALRCRFLTGAAQKLLHC